jgi:hypothetical protein
VSRGTTYRFFSSSSGVKAFAAAAGAFLTERLTVVFFYRHRVIILYKNTRKLFLLVGEELARLLRVLS